MKKLITSTLFLLVVFTGCSHVLVAQSNKMEGLETGSLSSQFEYAIKKSSVHQAESGTFQVIRRTWINKLKSNAMDSVKTLQNKIVSLESNVQSLEKELNVVKADLKETNTNLGTVTQEKDSIRFVGILLTKSVYNTLVWALILGLLVAFLVMLFLFKRSNDITVKTKEALNDKQDEFDKHRKWALEREQTLARDLNKLKQKYKGLD